MSDGTPDRALASEIGSRDNTPPLSIRPATIVAISGHVATIHMGGKDIPGVPVYFNVSPSVGSVVDVLIVGRSPRVIGVTG